MGSISSVLSSAVVSILGFQNEPECISTEMVSDPNPKSEDHALNLNQKLDANFTFEKNISRVVCNDDSNPLDFDWLRERCDDDEELVLDVLRSFCEQGQSHIVALNAIYNSDAELDSKAERLAFHAVT